MTREVTAEGFGNHQKETKRQGWTGDSYINLDMLDKLGIERYTAHEGVNRLVFIPARVRKWWGLRLWVHYGMGEDKNTWLCPKIHAKDFMTPNEIHEAEEAGDNPKSCCVCQQFTELKKDQEAARPFSYRKRCLFLVIDVRNEETIAKGVQLYDAPCGKVDGTMGVANALALINQQDADMDNFRSVSATLKKGYEFVFTRTGMGVGGGTGYSGHMIIDRKNDIPKEILDAAFDVPEIADLLNFVPAKEIRKKMYCDRPSVPIQSEDREYGRKESYPDEGAEGIKDYSDTQAEAVPLENKKAEEKAKLVADLEAKLAALDEE